MQDDKIILSKYQARLKILKGIKRAAEIIGSTMGPAGRNVIYESEYNRRVDVSDDMYDSTAPTVINDGIKIMSQIKFDDPIEDLGAQLLFEASKKTNTEAGDGTTTVIVLAYKLINEIMMDLNETGDADMSTINRMELKRELFKARDEAIEQLKKMATPVKTQEELEHIAITSCEDEQLGKKIAEAWWKIGKDGWVGVEGHHGLETDIDVHQGMRFNAKLMSEYMITNTKKEMEVRDTLVLVTNYDIKSFEQIKDWPTLAANNYKFDLVIFAPSFSTEVEQHLNTVRIKAEQFNAQKKGQKMVRVFAVKIPALTEKEGGQVEDLALFTGATFIDKNQSMLLENIDYERLGYAKKVFCSGNFAGSYAIIAGGKSTKEQINQRIKRLKDEQKHEKHDQDKKHIQNRIGSLSSGIAIIKVGAVTDTERRYSKLKLDDAVYACQAALQEGIVKGAGRAYKEIDCANKYLKKALQSPYLQIQQNANGKLEIPNWVKDPVKVERIALERAVSVAAMLITSDHIIAYKRQSLENELEELLKLLKEKK